MILRASKVVTAGAVLLGVISLGGCATKKYVRETIAPVEQAHAARLDALDKTTADAMARAEAAGKLAEGKFLYSLVLSDDSMKFGPGKSTLTPEAQARLDAFASKLTTDNRNVYVEIQGHTDASGNKLANYKIGEERAETVRRYLNQHGVALNRMGTISYGADAPVAPNNNREGRQANRRVVLLVLS
jgi:outer membrane protein OmpA-like peptidoglycan-associated protein